MSHRPISILTDCGDDYGVARVEYEDDEGHTVGRRADVDLNATDGTEAPRIRVHGSDEWVDVDETFVTAYRGLTSSRILSATSRTAACRAITGTDPEPEAGPETDEASSARQPLEWTYMAFPALGAVAQYLIDRFGRHDLRRIPTDFGALGTVADGIYIGGQALFVLSYIPIHRRWDPTFAWISDGVCVGSALGFGIGAAAQPRGDGTPELSIALTLGSTCGVAIIYGNNDDSRDPGRFWAGFGTQLALGALGIGLGAGGVGGRTPVSETDMYAPGSVPPGSRGVAGSPYEGAAFPVLPDDLIILGVIQAGGAVINLADFLLDGSGSSSPSAHVALSPLRGGFVLSVSDSF